MTSILQRRNIDFKFDTCPKSYGTSMFLFTMFVLSRRCSVYITSSTLYKTLVCRHYCITLVLHMELFLYTQLLWIRYKKKSKTTMEGCYYIIDPVGILKNTSPIFDARYVLKSLVACIFNTPTWHQHVLSQYATIELIITLFLF